MDTAVPTDNTQSLPFDAFLTDLIQAKLGHSPDPEIMTSMKNDLLPRLTKYIILKTMEELAKKSPTVLSKFQTMVTDNSSDQNELQSFVGTHIPDAPMFLAGVLLSFREIYLGMNAATPDSKP